MAGKIRILPGPLSQVIAAGEVIERPASVVKELMENAIDAGSSEVGVELQAGGFQLIRVRDNGEGMDREDVPVALQRHATSKIQTIEDLHTVQTLGFRGEALPSIASVSQMTLKTRPAHSLKGTKVVCEGGEIRTRADVGCPVGTEVEVRNLFYNVPVKRKFLKSISLELRHAANHFLRLSLAHPSLTFRFLHDGRLLHEHLRTENMKVRIEAILGREVFDQLQFFEYDDQETRLSGWASLPTYSRGNGEGISLYVNQRFVRDRMIYRAILEAYRHVIPQGRFPIVVLFLTVSPSRVDVNVHPTKTEVKFKEPERIFPAVYAALHALHEPISPSRVPQKNHGPDDGSLPRAQPLPLLFRPSRVYPQGRSMDRERIDWRVSEGVSAEGKRGEAETFRILGQILNTYILCEDSEGLLFIDQHAAHERILFEKLKKAYETESLPISRFLTPILMECSSEEAMALSDHLRDFRAMGFEIDPMGERVFAIRSVPSLMEKGDPQEMIRKVLEEGGFHEPKRKKEENLHPILVALSCHSAIRANSEMRGEEIEALIRDLEVFPPSTTCPHGRPVFFRLPFSALEKEFKRDPRGV
jgi:DNA mismatch repair protein MutL